MTLTAVQRKMLAAHPEHRNELARAFSTAHQVSPCTLQELAEQWALHGVPPIKWPERPPIDHRAFAHGRQRS